MPKLTIRGVYIHQFSKCSDKAGQYLHLVVHADISKVFAEYMGWENLIYDGDGFRGGWDGKIPLEGALVLRSMILTFTGGKHELALDVDSADHFTLHRTKEGESSKLELRFHLISRQAGAAATVETYYEKIQDGVGTLKLTTNGDQQPSLLTANNQAEEEDDDDSASNEEAKEETQEAVIGGTSRSVTAQTGGKKKRRRGSVTEIPDATAEVIN